MIPPHTYLPPGTEYHGPWRHLVAVLPGAVGAFLLLAAVVGAVVAARLPFRRANWLFVCVLLAAGAADPASPARQTN